MIHLTTGIGLVLEVGLALFCFVDVLLAPEAAVRVLPRWGWVLAILVFPLPGGAAYLLAGRPWRALVRTTGRTAAGRPAGPAGRSGAGTTPDGGRPAAAGAPDGDDRALLVLLGALNDEHEAMLRRWEDDLRRREATLQARGGTGGAAA